MYNDVLKFVEACDQEKTELNANLYKNLISEEFGEFFKAHNMNNEVEKLDACMDMIWVILGFCVMKGYDVNGAWGEVARSNLSKIDNTTGKVIKREDGKVMKPQGWIPPQLEQYLAKPTK
jgi:predicted HAD superfamily Cof-like phosphohydrolase